MKRDLVKEIVGKTHVSEPGLRATLSRIKRRHDLKTIQQAACFYIKKKKVPINVSSVIDDITRDAVRSALTPPPSARPSPRPKRRSPKPVGAPTVKWLPKRHYSIAARLSGFYPYLFIFENALRSAIDARMRDACGDDWWEAKIRLELSDPYKYAEEEEKRQSKLPIVGKTLNMPRLELVTVGHLEQIIQKYQELFVPSLFPSFHFFAGHMVIVKQVRNALAHVSPAATARDIRNARHEIDILLQHIATI